MTIQEIKDVTAEENLFVISCSDKAELDRPCLTSMTHMSCVAWLVYNNCVYFSRATIFDHTDLAEYLISLVNKARTHTHTNTTNSCYA